jgi:cyclic dehypoxanthinyl futalosine synthase
METAQRLGLGTTATMVIGFGESWKDRIEHLSRIRELQDKTGGFASFLLWTYQPDNTAWKGERVGNEDYLKAVALSRFISTMFP